ALSWSHLPEGTQSLALFCHDPDAPLASPGSYGFVHWVLYNIPASVAELPEGVQGYTSGKNDFGTTRYGGPMPPEGHGVHHYYFWLLALDRELDLPAELTLWQLLERVEPHVIGMNRLVGTYSRGWSPWSPDVISSPAASRPSHGPASAGRSRRARIPSISRSPKRPG